MTFQKRSYHGYELRQTERIGFSLTLHGNYHTYHRKERAGGVTP